MHSPITEITGRPSPAVARCTEIVGVVAIFDPFRNVPRHVEQAERVRLKAVDGNGALLIEIGHAWKDCIAPPILRRRFARRPGEKSRRLLPEHLNRARLICGGGPVWSTP